LEEDVFSGIFVYMFKERKTLNETMIWEKYEENQCKLAIISNI
jgi:hypothetical protein